MVSWFSALIGCSCPFRLVAARRAFVVRIYDGRSNDDRRVIDLDERQQRIEAA
jgi:hypothetical protein